MNRVMNRNASGSGLKGKDSKPCQHSRMLGDEYTVDHQKTGKLICKECGAIIADPRST